MHRIAVTALGALLCLSAPTPARADLVVNISKADQRLSVTIDGNEVYRWPVSTGVRRFATPAGKFRPQRLERHWYSRQYNLTPMPWSMFFHRGYAVHATMETYNLGRAASHGCVRLRPDNAAILYSLVRRQGMENTRVVVMNGPLPAAMTPAPAVPTPLPNPRPTPPYGTESVADASTAAATEHFAKLTPDEEGDAVKADTDIRTRVRYESADHRADRQRVRTRMASVETYRMSVGSEAQVLREREAWLRSLDRKYGITR